MLKKFIWLSLNQTNDFLHLRFPFSKFADHDLEMVATEITRKDPVDMHNLLDLIDTSFDELKAHCFHEQELNVFLVDLAMKRDAIEFEASVVLINFEKELQKAYDADLLIEVLKFFDDIWEAWDVVVVSSYSLLEL